MRRLALILSLAAAPLVAQQTTTMSVEEYEPLSTLVVPQHPRPKSKFPFIDIHNHQRRDMAEADAQKLASDMDSINMSVMVNLSGGFGDSLKQGIASLQGRYPKRFVAFANIDLRRIDEPGFGEKAARQLEEDVKNGAVVLKIFKNLGMSLTDASGKRVGEPVAFWNPVDKHNERWLGLRGCGVTRLRGYAVA